MTWLLLIFFSLWLMSGGWLLRAATPRGAGSAGIAAAACVKGAVELIDSHDPEVRHRKNYSGVVVWLEPVGSPAASIPAAEAAVNGDAAAASPNPPPPAVMVPPPAVM